MAFYTFNQNNSGGSFIHDPSNGISKYVIIEADTFSAARAHATSVGIYFDGVDSGDDCSCCGDRWYDYGADEGTEEPEIYSSPAADFFKSDFSMKWIDGPEAYIHYEDGSVEGILDGPRK